MENLGGDAPNNLDAACRVCRCQLKESSPLPLRLMTPTLLLFADDAEIETGG
jgi:hypothetical protein